jgi:acetoin utilization deacetylase AcuC-like enzyme
VIKFAFSSQYIYQLPKGHRFPIEKYELVKQQLVYEGTIHESQIFDPGLAEEFHILSIHTNAYWEQLKHLTLSNKEIRKIGLPVTEMSVKRSLNSVSGTIRSAENALDFGIGANLSGGTHHAYAGHGEGFCLLNDIAIAAQYLLDQKSIKKILIVDLDVHQGNGTAKIFEKEDRVFTFSIHGKDNYPLHKEKSDRDIELPNTISDEEYLDVLQTNLDQLIYSVKPEFIFYQSGVDVMKGDRLGKIGLSRDAVKRRDSIVISQCYNQKIPLVITMGGGYSNLLKDLVDAHCNTFRQAVRIYS